ncbi:hypothetical protein C8F04DRAFT_1178444 [Mycena alexandri]|uniref:Bacteriophage T5 Orf172 DNA-binding domain-containing protein n=1 Tax=Mycena alexandri TaxID=1745969 RepID=A0AAD6T5N9_9AGAR|nr:hypothetical protein C8F04DRAFT_1178444 [Mycena alexandri]
MSEVRARLVSATFGAGRRVEASMGAGAEEGAGASAGAEAGQGRGWLGESAIFVHGARRSESGHGPWVSEMGGGAVRSVGGAPTSPGGAVCAGTEWDVEEEEYPRFGDLMAQPLAQILALLAGPSPYMLDGEGLVYLHLRVRVTVWDAFQRGDISYAAFLDCLELKAGHTKDLKQRLYGYKPCAPGYIFVWRCAYTTTRRMLIERLIHLSLIQMGAQIPRYTCSGCGKRHREYFGFQAAGGFRGLERIVRYWLWVLGDLGSVSNHVHCGLPLTMQLSGTSAAAELQLTFRYPETKDIRNLICTPKTGADTYCLGLPDSDPDNKRIGNGFGAHDTFCLWLPDTAPDTNSIRSSIRNAEIAPETEGFGTAETDADMTRFGNIISLSKTFHFSNKIRSPERTLFSE